MKHIEAVSASVGLAMGTIRWLRHTQSGIGRTVNSPEREREELREAVQQAREQLYRLERRAPDQDKEIFMVQRVLLDDEGLLREVDDYIGAGAGAAAAVERAAELFANRIRSLDDDYMRERACDILDVCRRVVLILDGQPHDVPILTEPAIVAAEEVYPTDIVMMNRSMLLGIITSAGSPNAHAAILARTMGVPAVVMAGAMLSEQCDGQTAAMDGAAGEVYLNPDAATKARFVHKMKIERRRMISMDNLRGSPCITRDGTRIYTYSDCATVDDVKAAVAAGADGVGMLLSEYLLTAERLHEEEDQYQFYKECLEAAQGRPVTICTFDVGPETTDREFEREEPNPSLGICGIRYCLAHPEFFETQLCAMLRAGVSGNLRIVLPMVTSCAELDETLRIAEHAKKSLRMRGVPFAEHVPIGARLETPAAMIAADQLAVSSDFFSVGLSNLTQYTYAADRLNPLMRPYLPSASAPVYRMVRMALETAHRANIPLCVFGEGAEHPASAEVYARLGVREFSLPARELLEVKEYLMGITL